LKLHFVSDVSFIHALIHCFVYEFAVCYPLSSPWLWICIICFVPTVSKYWTNWWGNINHSWAWLQENCVKLIILLLQTTALHVCFLLLDITLALQDATKAAVCFLPGCSQQLSSSCSIWLSKCFANILKFIHGLYFCLYKLPELHIFTIWHKTSILYFIGIYSVLYAIWYIGLALRMLLLFHVLDLLYSFPYASWRVL
jgi:hypothetical protein